MIHATPPRIQSRMVAPADSQNVKVIVDAFNNPRTAAKHEGKIGRLMLKTVRRKPRQATQEPQTERRKQAYTFCENEWRTTAEIADHLNAHIETVRKLVKEMHNAGRMDRKPRQSVVHREYIYRSRDNLKESNNNRQSAAKKREQEIIDFAGDWKSCKDIAANTGFSVTGMRNKMRAMVKEGVMERRCIKGDVEYRRKV